MANTAADDYPPSTPTHTSTTTNPPAEDIDMADAFPDISSSPLSSLSATPTSPRYINLQFAATGPVIFKGSDNKSPAQPARKSERTRKPTQTGRNIIESAAGLPKKRTSVHDRAILNSVGGSIGPTTETATVTVTARITRSQSAATARSTLVSATTKKVLASSKKPATITTKKALPAASKVASKRKAQDMADEKPTSASRKKAKVEPKEQPVPKAAPKAKAATKATPKETVATKAAPKKTTAAKAAPKETTTTKAAPKEKAATKAKPAPKEKPVPAPKGKAKAPAKSAASKKITTTTATTSVDGPSATKKAPAKTSTKRKALEDEEAQVNGDDRPAKKSRTTTKPAPEPEPEAATPKVTPKPPPKAKPIKKARAPAKKAAKHIINLVPTKKMEIYACGEGSAGELGLGPQTIDVTRPRLNNLLSAKTVGVVQLVTGGMHCVALTHDNKILTWGVNDEGALGRKTDWSGGKFVEADAPVQLLDPDDVKSGMVNGTNGHTGAAMTNGDIYGQDSRRSSISVQMNPIESTPTAIPSELFPEGTVFVQVAAGDSISLALTDDGKVYGWGTFRNNEGILGFWSDKPELIQRTPALLPELKNIVKIACGANHCLALDNRGHVFSWGAGQQHQLGRRVIERTHKQSLKPREFGLPSKQIVDIACGIAHSFAIEQKGHVWAWGMNSFGETGIMDKVGQENVDVVVPLPTKVESLLAHKIIKISGGAHHSLAITEKGECLVWGRFDGKQTGLEASAIPEGNLLNDDRGRPRVLTVPTAVPGIGHITHVAAGPDHSLVINDTGKAYAWGFSVNYQTGVGTDDDVATPKLVNHGSTKNVKFDWAGAGGQFSMFASKAAAPTETDPDAMEE